MKLLSSICTEESLQRLTKTYKGMFMVMKKHAVIKEDKTEVGRNQFPSGH